MATSGTTTFDLDFVEIAEEAWERAGREMRSGYDLRTARRSMNLMMLEWQNQGVNLWTVEEGSIPLVSGTATYSLPTDTVDLLEATISENGTDIALTRISVLDFANIPTKTTTGRPVNIYIDRKVGAPDVTLWPVPGNSNYVLKYWRMRRIQDAGNGGINPDVNIRFYPALVSGLAVHLAMKVPELANRIPMLQQEAQKQYQFATHEDRDRATLRIVPRMY